MRGPSRLPPRPSSLAPHQPAGSFELAAFCGGSTTSRLGATHAEASRRALTQPPSARRSLGCRKRYLTSRVVARRRFRRAAPPSPSRLYPSYRHHPPPPGKSACTTDRPPVGVSCRPSPSSSPLPEVRSSRAPPTTATARGRHERPYERTSRLHRPREKIASLRFKCYEWRAWQIARWLLSRLAKLATPHRAAPRQQRLQRCTRYVADAIPL